jgi:ADP-ribosylglycohydrolase
MRKLSLRPDPLAAATLFEELTVDLVVEGGDADTNAAAACALLGAYLGYANLPSHWTLGLAHKE